ncbi:MAG: RND transporter, partial [Pseudomonadota bacterium]
VEIGDPSELEIVIDLLSSDAAGIKPGATVLISEWGGPEHLRGTVRRVDPAAFTKVSSLGIEEQRVNVIIDLDKREPALGHGFRVIGNLVVWQGDDVLQVPIGALFRSGGSWAVFLVREGRAQLRMIEIGHMNRDYAEIVSGLESGDAVILYPNDELKDGSLVERRNTASG